MNLNDQIEQAIDTDNAVNQFGMSNTPFHTHNGLDSKFVNFQNLTNRNEILHVIIPGTSAATKTNYGVFFIAPYACIFSGAWEVHQTAGTISPTLQIEKLTGTTASGSGINLLANAFDLTVAANTVQYGKLAQISNSNFNLAIGDRLGLVAGGTYTTVAQVCVIIKLNY